MPDQPLVLPQTPWFSRGRRGLPNPVDPKKADAQVVKVYDEAQSFNLVTHRDEREMAEARTVETRWHSNVIQATIQAAQRYPMQFERSSLELVARLLSDDTSLLNLENAHEKLRGMYADTRTLLRASLYALMVEAIHTPLEQRVLAGLKAGTPDPESLAAWEIIDIALKRAKDDRAAHQDDVKSAYERGIAAGRTESENLAARIRSLETQLAQRDAQLQELIKADPGRRQTSR